MILLLVGQFCGSASDDAGKIFRLHCEIESEGDREAERSLYFMMINIPTRITNIMLIFLHPVLATFFATLTMAENDVTSLYSARDASLDGKVSNYRLLFQTEVWSTPECALDCFEEENCVAFSVSPKGSPSTEITCRGYDTKSASKCFTVAAAGSKTYHVRDGESPAGKSSWLKRPCTANSDCPATVANVVCISAAGQCLCQPGYYYSHCGDDCVSDCARHDLQSTFLEYLSYEMIGQDSRIIASCTPSAVIPQSCVNDLQCRAFNLFNGVCYVHNPDLVAGDATFVISPNNAYYQRTCL